MNHSKEFDYWKYVYDEGFCTLDQLKEATYYEQITPEEFKEISGQEYIAKNK